MAERRKRQPAPATAAIATPPVVASSLRDRVPALSASAAEGLRQLFSESRRWPLADGGVLTVQAARVPSGDTIAIDADGMPLALRFAPLPPDPGADGLRWSDHVGRARVLAWSLAHEASLVRLSDALGLSLVPRLDAPSGDAAVADEAQGVWLSFAVDDARAGDAVAPVAGALRVPVAWLPGFAERAERPFADEPLPPLGAFRALPARVSLQFSITDMPMRDWRGLRPGDAIVVGRRGKPPRFAAHAAGRAWPLLAVAEGLRVDGPAQALPPPHSPPFRQEPSAMTDQDASDASPTSSDDPARQLPVRVAFEIGEIELPLGALADMQPGYVFALPAHLEGANVVIRANGAIAGRGEVVAVGETLGVRLLSWS